MGAELYLYLRSIDRSVDDADHNSGLRIRDFQDIPESVKASIYRDDPFLSAWERNENVEKTLSTVSCLMIGFISSVAAIAFILFKFNENTNNAVLKMTPWVHQDCLKTNGTCTFYTEKKDLCFETDHNEFILLSLIVHVIAFGHFLFFIAYRENQWCKRHGNDLVPLDVIRTLSSEGYFRRRYDLVNRMDSFQFSEFIKGNNDIIAPSSELNRLKRRFIKKLTILGKMGPTRFAEMCRHSQKVRLSIQKHPELLDFYREHLPEHLREFRLLLTELHSNVSPQSSSFDQGPSLCMAASSQAASSVPVDEPIKMDLRFADDVIEGIDETIIRQCDYLNVLSEKRIAVADLTDVQASHFRLLCLALETDDYSVFQDENIIPLYALASRLLCKPAVYLIILYLAGRINELDEEIYSFAFYIPEWNFDEESKRAYNNILLSFSDFSNFDQREIAEKPWIYLDKMERFVHHFKIDYSSLADTIFLSILDTFNEDLSIPKLARCIAASFFLKTHVAKNRVLTKAQERINAKRLSFTQCWDYAVSTHNTTFKKFLADYVLTGEGKMNLKKSKVDSGWMDLPEELSKLVKQSSNTSSSN